MVKDTLGQCPFRGPVDKWPVVAQLPGSSWRIKPTPNAPGLGRSEHPELSSRMNKP